MKISHIEHIGIAVKNIEECLVFYEKILGLKCYKIEKVVDQKVKVAFLKVGQTKIELLEPTSEDSVISKFIKKSGEGIHHVAFSVPNVKKSLSEAGLKGVSLVHKEPVVGAEGLNVGFLHPNSTNGVLVELCSN